MPNPTTPQEDTMETVTRKELIEKYNEWHKQYEELAETYGYCHPMVERAGIRLSALREQAFQPSTNAAPGGH